MEKNIKLPKNFFTRYRERNNNTKEEEYSKIEEIKWNKDIITGKNYVVGSLPQKKKVL